MANNIFLTMSGDKWCLNNECGKILEKFFPEIPLRKAYSMHLLTRFEAY